MEKIQRTVVTHNGSDAHRDHNIRAAHVVAKEEHIDTSLSYRNEILVDIPLKQAYTELFDAARIEYNKEMVEKGHPERQIKDYLAKIRKDKKKHPVYEMIVQIGNRDDTGVYGELELTCLKEFIAGWEERNPNLKLIGAYIHADETNGTLHAHLDYIPIAHNCSRGMKTQTALVQALGKQGFVGVSTKQTAQIAWEKRENETLEQICVNHGIEVVHPKRGEPHRDKKQYIEYQKQLDEIKGEIGEKQHEVEHLDGEISTKEMILEWRQQAVTSAEQVIDKLDAEYQEKNAAVEQLDTELEKKNAALTETAAALADNEARLEQAQKGAAHIDGISELVQSAEMITRFGKPTGVIKIPEEPFVKLKMAAKGYDEDRKEVNRLQGLLDKAAAEIKKLQDELKKATSRISEMSRELVQLQSQCKLFKKAHSIPEQSDYNEVLRTLNEQGYFQKNKTANRKL